MALLCDIVVHALAGSGVISPDDALELKLLELELNIRQQAQTLANKYQRFREERWVMSKEDLAKFKSADAKLLALQSTNAALDKMAAELGACQAVQPAGIMERAERDFSRQSLGATSRQSVGATLDWQRWRCDVRALVRSTRLATRALLRDHSILWNLLQTTFPEF